MSDDKPSTTYQLGVKLENVSLEEARKFAYAGVGKGWYPIIDYLFAVFELHAEHVSITQVKEKFGGLRFYADGIKRYERPYHVEVDFSQLIRFAEGISRHMCEVCSAPGRPRSGSWIRTVCDEHAEDDEQ